VAGSAGFFHPHVCLWCLQFFYQMESCGVKPNRHTMCVLIDGCGREGLVAKAFGIYGMMQAKVRPSACSGAPRAQTSPAEPCHPGT